MDDSTANEIIEVLNVLPENLLQEVLTLARKLSPSGNGGTLGSRLLPFAGVISKEDLELMRKVGFSHADILHLNIKIL